MTCFLKLRHGIILLLYIPPSDTGIFYPESDAGQSVQSGSILIQSPWPDSHFGILVWAGI